MLVFKKITPLTIRNHFTKLQIKKKKLNNNKNIYNIPQNVNVFNVP